jgi:hypothetical protein
MKTIAVIFTLVLISCGQQAPKQDVKVSLGNLIGPDIATLYPGGVRVYAQYKKDPSFRLSFDPTVRPSINLEEGDWDIAAIGWAGPGQLQGLPSCDYKGVRVSASEMEVVLRLATANCIAFADGFGLVKWDDGGVDKPKKATIKLCDGEASNTCAANAVATHYRVKLLSFDSRQFLTRPKFDSPGHIGSCTAANAEINEIIPFGSNEMFAPVVIEFFTDATCTTKASGIHTFADSSSQTFLYDRIFFKGLSGNDGTYTFFPKLRDEVKALTMDPNLVAGTVNQIIANSTYVLYLRDLLFDANTAADTTAPFLTGFQTGATKPMFGPTESFEIVLIFSEPVTAPASSIQLTLNVENMAVPVTIANVAVINSNTMSFQYTVTSGDALPGGATGIEISTIGGSPGSVCDAATNCFDPASVTGLPVLLQDTASSPITLQI